MKNKKWKHLVYVLIILLIAGLVTIKAVCRKPQEIIETIKPAYGSIQTSISTTGTVQPQNRLEIKPPISGRIDRILVKEGEKVKVGQALALMSSTERAALLDAAHPKGEEVVRYWREVYKPTPLIAPIDGEVIVRAVEPGQTVVSTDAVVVLSDRLIVKAQVDETDIGRVKVGQAAVISLDAYPYIKIKGIVDHISYESTVVNNVTIYEVDVLPEKVPDVFRSGMSANVVITEKSKDDILLIPLNAIVQDKDGNFVMLSRGKGKKAVKHKVEVGISDWQNVEVVSGLGPEDKIIVKTQRYLPSKKTEGGTNPFTPWGRKKR